MSENKVNKTIILDKLEKLNSAILESYLRDNDKTIEILEIQKIISEIIQSNSLECYFNKNTGDLEYFTRKFIKDTIQNILRQPVIYGKNGDEIAIDLLVSYLMLMTKICDYNINNNSNVVYYNYLVDNIKEIFDSSKSFFRESNYMSNTSIYSKKNYNYEKFNDLLNKIEKESKVFSVGDFVDVLIENQVSYHHFSQKYIWVRGKIEAETETCYSVFTMEKGNFNVLKDSNSILDVGTMTHDYEWRTSLKEMDVIDGFDRAKWYPSTILSVKREEKNGLVKCDYRVGFRLYPEHFPQYKDFLNFWNHHSKSTDSHGRQYIGDSESVDETITYSSKRLQPFRSNIFNQDSSFNQESYVIDDIIPFFTKDNSNTNEVKLIKNKSAYIVGRSNQFLYYFATLLKHYAENNGFDILLEKAEQAVNKLEKETAGDVINLVFIIFELGINYFHKYYLLEVGNRLFGIGKLLLEKVLKQEVKSIKKDVIEMVSKILRNYYNRIKKIFPDLEKTSDLSNTDIPYFQIFPISEIETLSLSCSIKLIKTGSLDKRIQSIKSLVEFIHNNKSDHKTMNNVFDLIKENELINEIFGTNSHSQLVIKSQELLHVLVKFDKLTKKEIELIWEYSFTTDLELKKTVIKMLGQLCRVMTSSHVTILLDLIYKRKIDKTNCLLSNEEVEFITELTKVSNNKQNLKQTLLFFLNCFYTNNEIEEKDKLDLITRKITECSAILPECTEFVLEICLASLNNKKEYTTETVILNNINNDEFENNEDVKEIAFELSLVNYKEVLTFALVSQYLTKTANNEIPYLDSSFKNINIVELFCENWIEYKKLSKEIIDKSLISNKTNNTKTKANSNIEDIIIKGFSHCWNVKCRTMFTNVLIKNDFWNFINDDKSKLTPISFLYTVLVDNSVCEFDENEYYIWLSNVLQEDKQYNNIGINNNGNNSLFSKQNNAPKEISPIINEIYSLFINLTKSDKKDVFANLNEKAFDLFLEIFTTINESNLKSEVKDTSNLNDAAASAAAVSGYLDIFNTGSNNENDVFFHSKIKPDELLGFEMLWRIVFDNTNESIVNKGITILHSLFSTGEDSNSDNRSENNFSLFKNNDSNINNEIPNTNTNYSDLLLKRCLTTIQESASQMKNSDSNTNNSHYSKLIIRSLHILKLIIKESEKNGTGGIKSHSALLKKTILDLKLKQSIKSNKELNLNHLNNLNSNNLNNQGNDYVNTSDDYCTIKILGNTTIIELKQLITNILNIHYDFLDIYINDKFISNTENGTTLTELNINFNDEIKVTYNKLLHCMKREDLTLSNGRELVPELYVIINSWFDMFSNDQDQMTPEYCGNFIYSVTGSNVSVGVDDKRISSMFDSYDKQKKGYISREDFLRFYKESITYSNKLNAVWENLNTMGIRNDLKRMIEPYFDFKVDYSKLPRYCLSHNDEFFNTLFYLQDFQNSDKMITKEAFEFLSIITTNPKIYKELLFIFNQSNNNDKQGIINWGKALNSDNIFKMIYSLEIIQVFLQQDDSSNSNNNSNNDKIDFLLLNKEIVNNDSEISQEIETKNIDNIQNIKKKWVENFILSGGYDFLFTILDKELKTITNDNEVDNSKSSNIFIELVLNIVKNLYIKQKHNNIGINNKKDFNVVISNLVLLIDKLKNKKSSDEVLLLENALLFLFLILIDNDGNNNLIIEKSLLFKLQNIIFSSVFSKLDNIRLMFENIIENLISVIISDQDSISENKSNKTYWLVSFLFEFFLSCVVIFERRNKKESLEYNYWNTLISIKLIDINSLINNISDVFCNVDKYLNSNSHFLNSMFKSFKELLCLFYKLKNYGINSHNDQSSIIHNFSNFDEELFSSMIVESIYIEENIKSPNSNVSNINNINSTNSINNKETMINSNTITTNTNNLLKQEHFLYSLGKVQLLNIIVENNSLLKLSLSEKYGLIETILTKILFKNISIEEIRKLFINDKYINKEFLNSRLVSSINKDINLSTEYYKLIITLIRKSFKNFSRLLNTNLIESAKESSNNKNGVSSAHNHDDYYYNRFYSRERREGHVGIRNLGCICYMNSMLQQFFMCSSFRYNLLNISDNKQIEENNYSISKFDDNTLHQIQRMFTFLDLSEREDYNPEPFCVAFKDWEGQSVNVRVQQDSQEFLNRFLDTIETQIKITPNKYLVNSVFGGKTCSQIICESCNKISNKFEVFLNLSLEVRSMSSLDKSLEKFICPERIDNFFCEECQKKVTIKKRNSIAELPNVLIVYLQRLWYNYEIDRNEKINSRLEFPKELNLKKYSVEELMRKEIESRNTDKAFEETDEFYFKSNEYYEYDLAGVNVHIGSADSGHYFSYINTVRDGEGNSRSYDRKNMEQKNHWLKFNDSSISKFNVDKIESECFGGSSYNNSDTMSIYRGYENIQSAYMLIYERKHKFPIKTKLEETESKEIMKKIDDNEKLDYSDYVLYREEEALSVQRKNDIFTVSPSENTVEFNEKIKQLTKRVFYDISKEEYYTYKNYYNDSKILPKEYFLEVLEDNQSFLKMKTTSDDAYKNFFNSICFSFKENLDNLECKNSQEAVDVSLMLLNYMVTNLSVSSDKKDMLITANEKIINIISLYPSEVSKALIEMILSTNYNGFDYNSRFNDLLVNQDDSIVLTFSQLCYNIIRELHSLDKTNMLNYNKKERDTQIEDTSNAGYCIRLLDFIISIFPRFPNQCLYSISSLFNLLISISKLGEEIIEYLVSKNIVCLLVALIIGKKSPYYDEYTLKNEKWSDYERGYLSDCDELVSLVFYYFKRSKGFAELIINTKVEELKKSINNDELLELAEKDYISIKHPSFIYFLLKNYKNISIVLELLTILSYNNLDESLMIITEITKLIEELTYSNTEDFVKLTQISCKLMEIPDQYQRIRIEALLGFPQMILEETKFNSFFPVFGYNKLSNRNSKAVEFKTSNYNIDSCSSIINKMYYYGSNDKTVTEVFLALLASSVTNHSLLKYLRFIPKEEPGNGNQDSNNSKDELNRIVKLINEVLKDVLKDANILPNFSHFCSKYLPSEIKREEARLVKIQGDLIFIRLDYYTDIVHISQDTQYNINSSISKKINENDIDILQNIVGNENIIITTPDKRGNDKNFLFNIIPYLTDGKTIVVQNENNVKNNKHCFVRYVCYNNGNQQCNLKARFDYTEKIEKVNEYIPVTPLLMKITPLSYHNIIQYSKLDLTSPFTDDKLILETQAEFVEYKEVRSNNSYFNGPYTYYNN